MDRLPMAVYREMRARPSYLSAFVPQTDDFFTRQNRCRNAILVDVLPPKNLGHFPQETLANKLASCFGGFPSDFHVAKYSERDFVIFLPEWVPAAQLVRREILSLDNLRLQCFPWNPYFGLRRASLTYNAWIRLVSLPYECWSSRTVAALVGGFGRFIRADDFSIRMVDLTGYRCLISVNFLSDIPENLEITVGDYSLSVLIQLERWGRRDFVDPGIPPNERTDQNDPRQRDHEVPRRSVGSVRGRRSSAGGSSSSDASWNSSEIRDRRREALIPDSSLRRKFSPSSADSIRMGEVESIRKGPAIVGRCGVTVGISKLSEPDVALIERSDVERPRSSPEIGESSSSPGLGRVLLSSSPGLGLAEQWVHMPTEVVCLGLGLDSQDTLFAAAGMGPSDPHGSEACCLLRCKRWGVYGGGVYQRSDIAIVSPPIGSVDGDFISPPATDLLPDEEGASLRDWRASTRSCARLTSVRQVSALDRAKRRKAVLLEGEFSGSTSVRYQRNSKKVLKKSALCGVKLTGVEAEELHKFLLRG
uniref:Uncharacterized protein n=1 Tax=Ananas comosus var. bracteatus TaxID=296719 RepID=A0A6V7Q224_ANACO|nr:unnamed protein product [Ananas comosus var. bracteatus]